MWDPSELADAAAEALSRRAALLRAEGAVRGLDSYSEVDLHAVLAEGLRAAGFGVYTEQRYPGNLERRPRQSARERCDLVLTAIPGSPLIDPVVEARRHDAEKETLFAAVGARADLPGLTSTPPEEAFWLEVKTIGQFTYTRGIPGPNRSYAAELIGGPVEDVIKLEWDTAVTFSGVLVVLFTSDEHTARHDAGVLMHRCLDRGLPVQSPALRPFTIVDLIGNAVCTPCLIPLRKGP
jgi:hypothetical protein